ncbi:uncharacterized protein LOC18441245 isoform X2 [Amborella trichopoda]|uniref:uncharacterized protein LOC18441245 isoform X2 n=1 Tax=Amborella trichopoda TaxID=13333 RepID=UPI0009BDA36C|nr:uncharacterized protein LOC18441245 isoform X2 [Amborella trichopoda]|eukprot:XP_020527285.1 uncharacterized protein LOC18441245 isoform X2 [Amborella trichopoda]
MAACRSLQYYFDNPKAKTSLLNDLDALASWGRMNPARAQVELAAITELFGELHFQEKPKFQVANEEEESADLSQDQENVIVVLPRTSNAFLRSLHLLRDIAQRDWGLRAVKRSKKP